MRLLLRWVLSAVAFWAVARFVPGIELSGWGVALLLAVLWGVIGVTVKPLLLVLTLPINFLTLGLFTFIVNGFLLWLLGGVIQGFEVHGFWTAVLGGVILSLLHTAIHMVLDQSKAVEQ